MTLAGEAAMQKLIAMGVTAVLAGLVTVTAQQAPAKPSADPDKVQQGSGHLPGGWKGRLDDPAAKIESVIVKEEQDALTFTTGPAGIYYKTGMSGMDAKGNYEVSASFSQLKPSTHPEAYGLFIGGQDLDKDAQRYVYFLVRQDGKFLIKMRTGATTKAIVDWTDAKTMHEPKGVKTSNTLLVRVMADRVHFLVNNEEVHRLRRRDIGADGATGIRVNHNLDIQVSKLTLKKLP